MKRKKDEITLHPEHCLNPTLGLCLYCGEETGEIGLLGFNGGKEAPRKAFLSIDPCKKCLEKYSNMVFCVVATDNDLTNKIEYTGEYMMVPVENFQPDFEIPKNRAIIISKELFDSFAKK